MPFFRIITFGCKVNQCDTADMAWDLMQRGWTAARPGGPADLVVVNTCTVTARADQQARQAIRRAGREHPGAALWVTGCGAERTPDLLAALPGVAGVLGNREKGRLAQSVSTGPVARPPVILVGAGAYADTVRRCPAVRVPGHTRGFLKVQDGCSHACSYCIVPGVRGPARSAPFEQVKQGLAALAADGCREVVLTGIDLGQYGLDLEPELDLAALLRQVADLPRPRRLRLSSLEPRAATPALLEAWAALPGACPHFHLPLQSGAAAVLRAMHRPPCPEEFRELVMEIRRRFPTAAIGVDVLAGFPTETARDFEATLGLLESLPLAYLHVFPFSPRPGTPAAARRPLPVAEVQGRAAAARALGSKKKQAFLAAQAGRVAEALIEGAGPRPGWLRGLTGNYQRVLVRGPGAWRNRLLKVRLVGLEGEALVGEVVERPRREE